MVSFCPAINCIRQTKTIKGKDGKPVINTAGFAIERTCRIRQQGKCPYPNGSKKYTKTTKKAGQTVNQNAGNNA